MTERSKNRKLGDDIRERREARNLDIRNCAERSGFHRSYWNKLEDGHYNSPSPKHLRVIGKVLRCPLDDLYSLAGHTPSEELPTIGPYLRAKYDLPRGATAELERYFDYLRDYYGIPKGRRVYPPKPKSPTRPKRSRQPKRRAA